MQVYPRMRKIICIFSNRLSRRDRTRWISSVMPLVHISVLLYPVRRESTAKFHRIVSDSTSLEANRPIFPMVSHSIGNQSTPT